MDNDVTLEFLDGLKSAGNDAIWSILPLILIILLIVFIIIAFAYVIYKIFHRGR